MSVVCGLDSPFKLIVEPTPKDKMRLRIGSRERITQKYNLASRAQDVGASAPKTLKNARPKIFDKSGGNDQRVVALPGVRFDPSRKQKGADRLAPVFAAINLNVPSFVDGSKERVLIPV